MNKLSVFYEHIFEAADQNKITVEQALLHAKNSGIDLLEVDFGRLSDLHGTKALFDSCGIGVSCIYRFFDMVNESAELCREKYVALFEAAQYLGADKVLCIPGFLTEDRERQIGAVVSRLNEMCSAAADYGITVTLEDFDDITSPCCRCDDIRYLMENVNGLRYTFDMGNFRYCLEDATVCYDKLSPYVVHVHCKDRSYDIAGSSADGSNGKADLSGAIMYPSVVCEGVIGIESLVKRLLSDGYKGTFAIEHFGAVNQSEYMKKSAENLRAAMKG